jgi:hypothetical protein
MNIQWDIDDMERRAADGFVLVVHWRVKANDNNVSAESYGSCGWDGETPQIPFEQLTKPAVFEWVWSKINKDEIEINLQKQIEKQKSKFISGTPW